MREGALDAHLLASGEPASPGSALVSWSDSDEAERRAHAGEAVSCRDQPPVLRICTA